MNFKIISLLIVAIVISPLYGFLRAQENYYHKTFTTENGLPHNHVYSIAQDNTGFLWIATWDGLSRYDGYEFRNYYHNPADSTSLAYFICEKVLVDFHDNVWIFGPSAISKYNRATDNFTQFKSSQIGGIALDKNGKLWCSTIDGIQYWDYEKNEFKPFEFNADERLKKEMKINPLYFGFDNNNTIYLFFQADKELIFYKISVEKDTVKKAIFTGEFDTRLIPKITNFAWDINFFTSNTSDTYIYGNILLQKLDTLKRQFLPYEVCSNITIDKGFQKTLDNQKFYSFKLLNVEARKKLNPVAVETYFVDNQNTLWQAILSEGANQTGLTHIIETPKGFKHYFTGMNPEFGLNAFFPVMKDKHGNIWAGPANVNALFVHKTDGTESTIKPVNDEIWKLASQRPRAFLEDSTGFWVGYFERLLIHYDFKNQSFRREFFKQTGIEDFTVPHSFVHMKKLGKDIIITGFDQIYRYNPKTKEFKELRKFEREDQIKMYSVFQDSDSTWWIGANKGNICHFDKDFNEFSVFRITKDWFNIEDIVQGDNNDLWLSLLGGGLAHFDKASSKTIQVYTTADGLPNNTLYGMLKDKHGNLWISTNHGISRFNPKTEQFRNFGPQDGLEIDEFDSDNTYLSPDGEMFFAGMGGVVSFYPDSIDTEPVNSKPAPLVLTDFKVSGVNRFFSKPVYYCDTVGLQKGDDNFSLTFACLDFVNAEEIKYRYRLEGETDDFTQTNFRNRTINFSNLLPGSYRLEVEATNTSREWVSKKTLTIIIPAFYYQTIWFRMAILLLIFVLVGYFIFSYNRRIRIQARQQQDELKLESLRGQMNPHFIFNSLNSINYFISQNDRLSANRYIADFSRLIRSILGNMLNDYIPLENELESIGDYLKLEHLRFSDKFEFELDVDKNVRIEQNEVFPGMVQPFIENAIWHGIRGLIDKKGKITAKFIQPQSNSLIAIVEDDGIGRKKAESRKSTLPGRTSRGIGIVLERLRIINHLKGTNYKVKIEDVFPDKDDTGTRVTIEIPLKTASSTPPSGYFTD